MESDLVTWFIFFAVLVPSIVFAIQFVKIMWIEILKIAASKSAKAFRYLTCGTIDVTEFKERHMDDEEEQVEVHELAEKKPK